MANKVLILEDDPLVSLDLREILELNGFIVTGNVPSVEEAIAVLNNRETDFVLLDINVEGDKDGVELAEIINKQYKIPFAFITAYSDDDILDRVKQTNPVGFVVKPFDERQVIAAIKVGMFTYKAHNKTPSDAITMAKIKSTFNELTERESEIFKLLIDAKSNKEIAEMVSLSVNTVKVHLKNLFIKLDVKSRLEAVQKAIEHLS